MSVKISLAVGALLLIAKLVSPKPARPHRHLSPGANRRYKSPPNWPGTPIDKKGRFVNHEHPYYQDFATILKWIPGHLFYMLRHYFYTTPVMKHEDDQFLYQENILIWLGHASFYLHIGGKRLLIDPHFYNTSLYKRHSDPPIDPALFTAIDYILLSHDHADHLDKRSLQLLVKNNQGVTILTGLGMETILQKYLSKQAPPIYCADWFEAYPLPPSSPEVVFVPSRHYSKRVDTGYNKSLWGGFIITTKTGDHIRKTIYHAGDSGPGNHFELMSSFKPGIALIGIGAYKPSWLMASNHTSPKEALQAFKQTGADVLIPMHYGTFNLAYEGMKEPLQQFNHHRGNEQVTIPQVGEIIRL